MNTNNKLKLTDIFTCRDSSCTCDYITGICCSCSKIELISFFHHSYDDSSNATSSSISTDEGADNLNKSESVLSAKY